MNNSELANRFKFHPATDDTTKQRHEDIRAVCGSVAAALDILLPDGREQALAITKLEEVMFWANAAIARNHEEA